MNHLYHTSAKPQTDSTSHFCDEGERRKFWVKWLCYCNNLIHWQINLDVLVRKWSYSCCHNLTFIFMIYFACTMWFPYWYQKEITWVDLQGREQFESTVPSARVVKVEWGSSSSFFNLVTSSILLVAQNGIIFNLETSLYIKSSSHSLYVENPSCG